MTDETSKLAKATQDILTLRLDRIEADIKAIRRVLEGNGQDGLKTSMSLLEQKLEDLTINNLWLKRALSVQGIGIVTGLLIYLAKTLAWS